LIEREDFRGLVRDEDRDGCRKQRCRRCHRARTLLAYSERSQGAGGAAGNRVSSI
jgi:hypothetical protein